MDSFIGRKKELKGLQALMGKRVASLVVIRGRRRIGKSRLAEEFGKSFSKTYTFTGLPPSPGVTTESQKQEFIRQMRSYQIPSIETENWGDLFADVAKHCRRGRVLVVLDEISWMGQGDPTFLGKVKIAWDIAFKKNPHLVMILSGSQSTWIKKNILKGSGFVGRISHQLKLEELSLPECNEFWDTHTTHNSPYEKLKLLSVTGGVPRYLEEIQPKIGAEENIRRLCFESEGLLYHEFDQIFSDLFSKRSEKYKQIVRSLAEGKGTIEKITQALGRNRPGRSKGGDISDYLDDLCQSGFLTRDYQYSLKTGKPTKLSEYRLSDNYLRFYLKYIEPNKTKIKSGLSSQLPKAWWSVLGLQFENLILSPKNRLLLYQQLNIPTSEIIWANPYFQTSTKQHLGCQIDFCIQTKFNNLYLCEIKFKKDPLGPWVIKEVEEKIRRLKIPRGFSIRPILIHVNGVSDAVLERDFFAQDIDFHKLLVS